ncbi:NAD(P)-binding protein [Schizophyllum commune H4-8]|uniref:NAD(P)-binding protein n=1 Tax=Schizophyllum commune (strain H4-8 / FGSC 9210) TaxID=578458 RepID=D8Q3W7_SCHCM|nr:NAD(P)-binding protein [Schizophyllum commune H4-8]KAI5892859.1 NAD(P)-binding protein [Schizophyllum commune H4-8]
MSSTIYLLTGANRGIGLGLAKQIAARPDTILFAGARDPEGATDLQALAAAHPGRVHVLKVVSADKGNNAAAVEEVKRLAGRLDVVIANAGISDCFKPALEVPPEEMIRHVEVNTNGPLVLFQATHELLRKSAKPKFIVVSSGVGSITVGATLPVNTYAYGASKAAVNWVTRKLHHDFPDFIIFPINPGGVDTDLAHDSLARDPGMKGLMAAFPMITAEESAQGMLEQIDVATRETHGGNFVDYTGLGKWAW